MLKDEKRREPRLAVLIDADNASARHARAIFEEIAQLGQANVRRIYGDFVSERLRGWRDIMQSLSIVPTQQSSYTTGKNAADITLVIDAMDLAHQNKLDGFCLVSSDSDFTRLAQRLREDGVSVFGFGAKKTPEAFRNACSRFIYVENLGSEDQENESTGKLTNPKTAKSVGTTKITAAPPLSEKKLPPSQATPLIRKAMEQAWNDEDWINLSMVGTRLLLLAPDLIRGRTGAPSL